VSDFIKVGVLFSALSSFQLFRNPLKRSISRHEIKIKNIQDDIYRAIVLFGVKKLTIKQKELLIYLYKHGKAKTLTYLAKKYSEETGMSYSTVKWNLRELRDLNLITGGDIKSKGEVVRLTKAGEIVAKHIKNYF